MKRVLCLILTLVMLVGMFAVGSFADEVELPVVADEDVFTVAFQCAECMTKLDTEVNHDHLYFGGLYEIEGVTKVNLHLNLEKAMRWIGHNVVAETADPCVTYALIDGVWTLVAREEGREVNSFGTVAVECETEAPEEPEDPEVPEEPEEPEEPVVPEEPEKPECDKTFTVVIDYNRGRKDDIKKAKIEPGVGIDLEKPHRRGYIFIGWYIGWFEYTGTPLYFPCTIQAKWVKADCCTKWHDHKIVYTDGVKDKVIFRDVVKYVDHGDKTPTIKDPTREGYRFAGWSPKVSKYATECVTYVAKWVPANAPALNTEDHVAYLKGYGKGEIRPEGNITRAEVATILYRLLDEDSKEYYFTTKNSFGDVNSGDWYNDAVSTLANAGVITGYGKGLFNPNAPITRAELVVMLARLSEEDYTTKCRFVDVPDNHWAYEEIALAQAEGWVKGYGAGYFYPSENVTRAEVAAILNRMLDRDDCVLKDTKNYVDNPVNAWYYEDMLEASIAH